MGESVKRVALLSTQFVNANFTLALLIASAFAVSCTNQASLLNSVIGGTTYTLGTDTTSGSGGAFQLDTVLPSQEQSGSYDLIGEGGQFDSYCKDSANPNTKCQCQYTYTQGNVGQQVVTAPITYQETNMMICNNTVPSGISTFNVQVITTSGTYASNSISVNLNNGVFAGSSVYLDLSNSLSFLPVQRFQCRKHLYIPNPMDPKIIDPFQSEDPNVIYPFNFYTTNVADSLIQIQNLGSQDWECTLTGNQTGSAPTWSNPNVFSAAPCTTSFCAGDGALMYPQNSLVSGKIPVTNPAANGKRRASFWLAKQAYGVFSVPLVANVAPNDYVGSTQGIIGYAAQPIPNSSGSSSCPAITLPAKATWVKIWNFNATNLTPPSYVTSSTAIQQAVIACNPDSSTIPSCDMPDVLNNGFVGPAPPNVFGNSLSNIGPTAATAASIYGVVYPMAARAAIFAGTSAVVSGGGSATAFSACYNINETAWANGGETWIPSPYSAGSASIQLSVMQGFPWNLYSAITSNSCPVAAKFFATAAAACPAGPAALAAATPSDTLVQTQALLNKNNNADNFVDQLFVAVDQSQQDSAIQNGGVPQYIPVTFRSAGTCMGPSLCASTANTQQILWQVVSNTNPVPTPTPSGTPAAKLAPNTYPLCVVQFYD